MCIIMFGWNIGGTVNRRLWSRIEEMGGDVDLAFQLNLAWINKIILYINTMTLV